MGFLDKLLGRGKQVARAGVDMADKAVDKTVDVAKEGVDKAREEISEMRGGGGEPGEGEEHSHEEGEEHSH